MEKRLDTEIQTVSSRHIRALELQTNSNWKSDKMQMLTRTYTYTEATRALDMATRTHTPTYSILI